MPNIPNEEEEIIAIDENFGDSVSKDDRKNPEEILETKKAIDIDKISVKSQQSNIEIEEISGVTEGKN